MRLLLDQDVYASTFNLLREAGFDVIRVAELLRPDAPDNEVLSLAVREDRMLVTRDLDFGLLVGLEPQAAVIILRFRGTAVQPIHDELLRLLAVHGEASLRGSVVVVEPGRHRVRRLAEDVDGG